jgi:hypothetical protein
LRESLGGPQFPEAVLDVTGWLGSALLTHGHRLLQDESHNVKYSVIIDGSLLIRKAATSFAGTDSHRTNRLKNKRSPWQTRAVDVKV